MVQVILNIVEWFLKLLCKKSLLFCFECKDAQSDGRHVISFTPEAGLAIDSQMNRYDVNVNAVIDRLNIQPS